MRLSGGEAIVAAADAGVTVFDTARSYDGNERLLAQTLRGRAVRIVTKGGMARPDGRWVPDGRARTLRADCESSLEALDGLPIDLYLVHAPDPRTPWQTTIRALAKLVGRRPRAPHRRREREPPPARRGARARTDRRRASRAQCLRRPGGPRRCRRALRGARAGRDRSLAARRASPDRAAAAGRDVAACTARRPSRSRSRGCSMSRPR